MLDGDPAAGMVHVVVPAGFETQWRRALAMEPAFVNIALAQVNQPVPTASTWSQHARRHHVGRTPAPAGGPPASVVERLTRAQYAAIEQAGGMPITLTATGASAMVHQQLAHVSADGCRRLPPQFPDEYECGTHLKVRSCLGACDPAQEAALDDAKRIFIAWDDVRGEWVNR